MNIKPLSLLILTRYPRNGPSSRQRFFLYADFLREQGIHVTINPFFSAAYLERYFAGERPGLLDIARSYGRRLRLASRVSKYDVVWIEKEVLPWLPASLEHRLIGRGVPTIIDFDDAWHLRYAQVRRHSWGRILANKLEELARSATLVTVANESLRLWCQEIGCKRVALMPTVVDLNSYPPTEEPGGPFTIGWIGTPANIVYFNAIAGALRRLSDEGARLLIISRDFNRALLPGVAIETVPWSEDTEAHSIARCHVGIMPLPGGGLEQFKSGYKLIQYMAAGRPVVASPIGANLNIVREGETGFFAHTEEEWYQALVKLRDDAALRRRLGLAGRRRCEEQYSLAATRAQLLSLITELASTQTTAPAPKSATSLASQP